VEQISPITPVLTEEKDSETQIVGAVSIASLRCTPGGDPSPIVDLEILWLRRSSAERQAQGQVENSRAELVVGTGF